MDARVSKQRAFAMDAKTVASNGSPFLGVTNVVDVAT